MSASKSKKIQGKELNNCFTNCKIQNTLTDGRLMAVNDKYLIMSWNCNYPGTINMVDSNNPCNLDFESNTFSIESSNILDMEFSPFYSNVFSFSNENKKIYVAKITKENQIKSDFYDCHTNKVYFIDSNPSASNVICSSTSFGEIHIWDSIKFEKKIDYKMQNNINSILWNPSGSLLGISTTNKLLTIIDPRNSTLNFEEKVTDINSRTKFVWLNDNSFASIGYKTHEKIFYLNLYDIRQNIKNPFTSINIGSYGSSLTPFVDPELNIIYITAKDDYYIKFYDYSSGKIQKYPDFRGSEINNFSIQLNRKYLNKRAQEIDRFARFTKNNKIYYTSFILKEISQDYNGLIYPSENSYYPSMTAEEWFSGGKTIPQKVHNNSKHTGNNKMGSTNQNQNYIQTYQKNLKNKGETKPSEAKKYIYYQQQNKYDKKEPVDNYNNYSNNYQKKISGKLELNEFENLKNGYEELEIKNQELNNIIRKKDEKIKQYEFENNSLKEKMEIEKNKYISQMNSYKQISKRNNELIYQNKNAKASISEQNKSKQFKKGDNKESEVLKNIENLKKELNRALENEKILKNEIKDKNNLIKSNEETITTLQKELNLKENLIKNNENLLQSEKSKVILISLIFG